jgi:hypothetical protein
VDAPPPLSHTHYELLMRSLFTVCEVGWVCNCLYVTKLMMQFTLVTFSWLQLRLEFAELKSRTDKYCSLLPPPSPSLSTIKREYPKAAVLSLSHVKSHQPFRQNNLRPTVVKQSFYFVEMCKFVIIYSIIGLLIINLGSGGRAISIATRWSSGFRFLAGARDYSLLQSVHTGSAAHPVCYVVSTGDSFPEGTAAGT